MNVVEEKHNTEKHMDHWTSTEKETCKSRYGCEILVESGSYADVCTKEAPRDAYIVKYVVDEKICFDLNRGSRMCIFDLYWYKFREILIDINFGCGNINPRTWGYQAPKIKKRK